jgi:hypothetical protein
MSKHDETSESELIAALRKGLAASDPVPSDATEFARAAFTWRDLDADLAELEYDSAEEEVPAGVRSSTVVRMMSFQAGRWMIDIEYDETAGRIMGATSPPARFTIELHTAGARFATESDESGRFTADEVARGPLAMILRFSDGSVVKTPWVVL